MIKNETVLEMLKSYIKVDSHKNHFYFFNGKKWIQADEQKVRGHVHDLVDAKYGGRGSKNLHKILSVFEMRQKNADKENTMVSDINGKGNEAPQILVDEIMNAIFHDTAFSVNVSDFDCNADLLNTPTGVLDFKRDSFFVQNPDYLLSKVTRAKLLVDDNGNKATDSILESVAEKINRERDDQELSFDKKSICHLMFDYIDFIRTGEMSKELEEFISSNLSNQSVSLLLSFEYLAGDYSDFSLTKKMLCEMRIFSEEDISVFISLFQKQKVYVLEGDAISKLVKAYWDYLLIGFDRQLESSKLKIELDDVPLSLQPVFHGIKEILKKPDSLFTYFLKNGMENS